MLKVLIYLNLFVAVVMTAAYAYQILFTGIGLLCKCRTRRQTPDAKKQHRFAALICARNEETVIVQLIQSLKAQNYPAHLLDVYVLADNCTDNTAGAAEKAGAIVYRRFDKVRVGKGYALDYLLKKLGALETDCAYDGYFVFDADNIVNENFVAEMNKTFEKGYPVITCYRNSKNFGANWISAGYSIWFLREARFLNYPRMLLGTNCAISGTGFLVSKEMVRKNGGWPFHLLTEDIQFTVNCAVQGDRIGYCDKAVVYDEQPTSFKQSWKQRMRWSKGFYQVDANYAGALTKGMFCSKGQRMSCYDMLMTVAPGMLLVLVTSLFNLTIICACFSLPAAQAARIMHKAIELLAVTGINFYVVMFLYGLLTVLCEWKLIHAPRIKKLCYIWLFPIFMATYLPIAIVALVRKVRWEPIRHCPLDQQSVGATHSLL